MPLTADVNPPFIKGHVFTCRYGWMRGADGHVQVDSACMHQEAYGEGGIKVCGWTRAEHVEPGPDPIQLALDLAVARGDNIAKENIRFREILAATQLRHRNKVRSLKGDIARLAGLLHPPATEDHSTVHAVEGVSEGVLAPKFDSDNNLESVQLPKTFTVPLVHSVPFRPRIPPHPLGAPFAAQWFASLYVLEPMDPGTPCWLWRGTISTTGYGRVRLPMRDVIPAHVFSYRLFRGGIPEGLELDHLCRVPPCVNPWHLEAVTTRVNVLRGEGPAARNARKTECHNGHPLSGKNLYTDGSRRRCRACKNARETGRRQRLAPEVRRLALLDMQDAPQGKTWFCPDCSFRHDLAGSAGNHARDSGHAVPELKPCPRTLMRSLVKETS